MDKDVNNNKKQHDFNVIQKMLLVFICCLGLLIGLTLSIASIFCDFKNSHPKNEELVKETLDDAKPKRKNDEDDDIKNIINFVNRNYLSFARSDVCTPVVDLHAVLQNSTLMYSIYKKVPLRKCKFGTLCIISDTNCSLDIRYPNKNIGALNVIGDRGIIVLPYQEEKQCSCFCPSSDPVT